jgi:hypothetical protein
LDQSFILHATLYLRVEAAELPVGQHGHVEDLFLRDA